MKATGRTKGKRCHIAELDWAGLEEVRSNI